MFFLPDDSVKGTQFVMLSTKQRRAPKLFEGGFLADEALVLLVFVLLILACA